MSYIAISVQTYDLEDTYDNLIVGKSIEEVLKCAVKTIADNGLIMEGYLFELASGMELNISCAAKNATKETVEALIGEYYCRDQSFGFLVATEESCDLSEYDIQDCVFKEVEQLILTSLERTQIDIVRELGHLNSL